MARLGRSRAPLSYVRGNELAENTNGIADGYARNLPREVCVGRP